MDPNATALDLAERYWEAVLELEPVLATSIGDDRYDDRLPDPSETGRGAAETVHRGAKAELAALDGAALGPVERTTLDVVDAIAGRAIAGLEHRTDRLIVANQMAGPAVLPGELATLQRADSPDRLERYERRLRAVPTLLEAYADIAREGVADGVVASRVVAERAVGMLDRLMDTAPEDAPFVQPAGDDAEARERLAAVTRDVVLPAYARYREELRAYLPHTTETIALTALPGGDGIYEAEIRSWTTLSMPAQDIHDLGRERFEAIQAERFEIAGSLGFDDPNTAIADRTARGDNTPVSAEALMALAEDQVRRSWEAAPAFFGVMPSANCVVQRVPAFMEDDAPGAYYYPPTEDGSRPGTYFINCSSLESRPLHQVASITYHEANPGHHFQVAVEQGLSDLPRIRRFGGILAGSAYVEGWGLYSERLADEMGLFLDDWERLGMLDAQAWRAGRLITDTGIHVLGWDRQRAVDTLIAGGVNPVDAGIETDRYIAIPGQALSYMLGMIEIQRAREATAAREGGGFSLSGFHDRILTLGQLPLPALRRELGSGP